MQKYRIDIRSIVSFSLTLMLIVLFVLLIVWLYPNNRFGYFYNKIYPENLQTMKIVGKNYFTKNNLPKEVGETIELTLWDMLQQKRVIDFVDKNGNSCDMHSSYVSATKTLDGEYALRVQLNCGEETEYIVDTIGCNKSCSYKG